MTGLQRIEHAKVHVDDLEPALDFYTGAMGLVEIARQDDTVYLGCGFDDNFDFAVSEGGTGIEHFAVRATDSSVVDDYAARLDGEGVDVERVDGDEPGQVAGVRFELPTGVRMEVVAVADPAYEHSTVSRPGREGHAPSTLDHVQWFTPDLTADLSFLRDRLDMHVSDTAGPRDDPELAFARCNTLHHDVALKGMPEGGPDHASLHHVAWGFDSIGHMKLFLDATADRGMAFEHGIGRHFAGNNLFAYFWEPGGNRFEMCAEQAVVKTPEPAHSADYESATLAWGPAVPDTFAEGSGLVRED